MFDKKEERYVYVGADHAGYDVKNELKPFLEENGFSVTDLGCFTDGSCDYPDIAREVSEKVLETKGAFGILICGTGIGMSMAANKLHGIRAALCTDANVAELARKHNDANVLAIGSRTIDLALAKKICLSFLNTKFEAGEERHVRRVEKIDGDNKV